MKVRYILILTLVVAISLLGCRRNFDITATNAITSLAQIPATEIKTDSLIIRDSVTEGENTGLVTISAEYPVSGNFFVVNSIFEWMSEELGGTFKNPSANPKEMFDYYSNTFKKDLAENILPDLQAELQAFRGVEFKKVAETDKFVTYTYGGSGYSGGAHGFATYFGQTFRKSDGRRIDYDIFRSDKQSDLVKMIKAGIEEQYFESETALEDAITMNDYFGLLPLPQYSPVFLENGVMFVYQQYEITCYAAGMPQCIIPYEQIRPLLTQTGLDLLSNEALAADKR